MMGRNPVRATLSALAAAVMLAACAATQDFQAPGLPQPTAHSPEPVAPVRPAEATPQQRSVLRTDLAAGYYERGRLDVALEELGEAVKLDPTNARAFNLFGLVYALLGDRPNAERSFQRALTLAPQDSDVHHNWGWYLCMNGRQRDALREFDAALRNPLYRTPEVALVNAGRCSASIGDIKGAEAYFRRALAAVPGEPNAHYGLAMLAYKRSELSEARNWIRGAVLRGEPTPEALYLGMCIERRLGDRQAELSYASQLRNRHPQSAETRAISTGVCE